MLFLKNFSTTYFCFLRNNAIPFNDCIAINMDTVLTHAFMIDYRTSRNYCSNTNNTVWMHNRHRFNTHPFIICAEGATYALDEIKDTIWCRSFVLIASNSERRTSELPITTIILLYLFDNSYISHNPPTTLAPLCAVAFSSSTKSIFQNIPYQMQPHKQQAHTCLLQLLINFHSLSITFLFNQSN